MKTPKKPPASVTVPGTTPSDVIKLREAAAILLCNPETARKMAKKGLIPGRRVGSGWRFSKIRLHQWMQNDDDEDAA